jgi:Possible tRNA binding domain
MIELGPSELSILLSPFDLKRLESYANNMLDYHVILDLLPTIAALYFEKRLGDDIRLSAVQSSILLALGLQRKTIEEAEVCIIPNQIRCVLKLPFCMEDRAAASRFPSACTLRQDHQENQQTANRHTKSCHNRPDA